MTDENSMRQREAQLRNVPMSYLKKGDRFVAKQGSAIVSGVADMDGHRVSEDYGYRVGNMFYMDPQVNYINVKLDGAYYEKEDPWSPNDGLYEREGWDIYVTKDIYDRVQLDIFANANWEANKEKRQLEEKKARLQAQVAELQKKIEEL